MLTASRRIPFREPIVADPGSSMRLREYRLAAWRFSWHEHPEWELTTILVGTGLRYVGNAIAAYGPGDCCLLPGGLPHTWTSEPQPGRVCRAICAQFPVSVFGARLELAETAPLRALAGRAKYGLMLHGATRSTVISGLRDLLCIRDPLDRLHGLWRLLGHIAVAPAREARPISSAPAGVDVDPRVARILALIHARAAQGLGQHEAAAAVGLAPAAFSRWFVRRLGQPFIAYRTEVRLGIARQLLREGTASVLDVALTSGFNNLANFNRRFRAACGQTPSQFRRSSSH